MMKIKALGDCRSGICRIIAAYCRMRRKDGGARARARCPAGPQDAQDVVTEERIAAVKKGMSVGEVAAIFGQEGVLVGQSIVDGVYSYTYRWQDGGNKIVNATFSRANHLNNPAAQLALVEAEISMSKPVGQRTVK